MKAEDRMVTGFQSNQANVSTHANTHTPRHTSVSGYMDTVYTVNVLYINFTVSRPEFLSDVKRFKWEAVRNTLRWDYFFPFVVY